MCSVFFEETVRPKLIMKLLQSWCFTNKLLTAKCFWHITVELSNLQLKYLEKFEAICEIIFTCQSGPQGEFLVKRENSRNGIPHDAVPVVESWWSQHYYICLKVSTKADCTQKCVINSVKINRRLNIAERMQACCCCLPWWIWPSWSRAPMPRWGLSRPPPAWTSATELITASHTGTLHTH